MGARVGLRVGEQVKLPPEEGRSKPERRKLEAKIKPEELGLEAKTKIKIKAGELNKNAERLPKQASDTERAVVKETVEAGEAAAAAAEKAIDAVVTEGKELPGNTDPDTAPEPDKAIQAASENTAAPVVEKSLSEAEDKKLEEQLNHNLRFNELLIQTAVEHLIAQHPDADGINKRLISGEIGALNAVRLEDRSVVYERAKEKFKNIYTEEYQGMVEKVLTGSTVADEVAKAEGEEKLDVNAEPDHGPVMAPMEPEKEEGVEKLKVSEERIKELLDKDPDFRNELRDMAADSLFGVTSRILTQYEDIHKSLGNATERTQYINNTYRYVKERFQVLHPELYQRYEHGEERVITDAEARQKPASENFAAMVRVGEKLRNDDDFQAIITDSAVKYLELERPDLLPIPGNEHPLQFVHRFAELGLILQHALQEFQKQYPERYAAYEGSKDATEVVEDDELIELSESNLTPVSDTLDISALKLKEINNMLMVADAYGDGNPSELAVQLEALRFTDAAAIEAEADLTDQFEALIDALSEGELPDNESIDQIATKLRVSREAVLRSLKSVDELLADQARASVQATEAAKQTFGGIAAKMGAYFAVGTALSIAGAGIGGVAVIGATRVIENVAREVRQRDQIKAKLLETRAAIANDKAVRATIKRELAATLAERKQSRIEGRRSALSEIQVLVNFAQLALPDAYDQYLRDLASNPDEAKRQLAAAIEAAGHGETIKQLLVVQQLQGIQDNESAQLQQKFPKTDLAAHVYGLVMEGKGDLNERNVTSFAFTMAAITARSIPGLRNALGAIAGARLSTAAARFGAAYFKKENFVERGQAHGGISLETLKRVDTTKVEESGLALAQARQRLREDRTLSASQRAELKTTIDQIEQALIKNGLLTQEKVTRFAQQVKTKELNRTQSNARRKLGLQLIGAAAGGIFPELVHAATDHIGSSTEAVPATNLAENAGSHAGTPAAPGATEPAAPAGVGASVETTTQPAAHVETVVKGTEAELSHVVEKGRGLSHALRGQDSGRVINAALHDTKVSINGHEISLMQTGVRHGDEISVSLRTEGNHKVIDLFDTRDGHRITESEMDKYLYDIKTGPGEVTTGGDSDHIPEDMTTSKSVSGASEEQRFVTGDHAHNDTIDEFRAPFPEESMNQYLIDGARDYIVHHPELAHLGKLSNEQLLQRSELQVALADLEEAYEHRTSGGGGEAAATVGVAGESARPLLNQLVNEQTHRLTEKGIERLGLQEHISARGEVRDYGSFRKEMLQLLDSDRRDRITGPNGLIFEERNGQLYVDVVGGSREHFVLDEQLYKELMAEYKGHVAGKLDGHFDKETFFKVLDHAIRPHDARIFEQENFSLTNFNSQGTYESFQGKLRDALTLHGTDKLRGANGLTFIQDDGKLYVRSALTKFEITKPLYDELMKRRLSTFDGELLATVAKTAGVERSK